MDIAFFDPDISHADHLSAALLAHLRAEQVARPVRAAKYGADAGRWLRGKTPDDLRDAFDERVQAALREMREATAESEDGDGDDDEGRMTTQAWPGVGGRATLATPPTSGDEEEEEGGGGAVGKRKRGDGDGWAACKRVRVRTGFDRRLVSPEQSPKRTTAHAARRNRAFARMRFAGGIELYNTHAMTTRSKARRCRNAG